MLLGVIRINTKKVAFGGLMTAMSVVVLYLSSVLPTLKLTACVISSVIVCIAMLKSGYLTATLVCVASAVVSLMISPDKTIALSYALVFGNYPILKAFIEMKNNLSLEWVLKVILFAVYACAVSMLSNLLFSKTIVWYVVFVIVIAGGVFYDFAISIIITEVKRRFSKIL